MMPFHFNAKIARHFIDQQLAGKPFSPSSEAGWIMEDLEHLAAVLRYCIRWNAIEVYREIFPQASQVEVREAKEEQFMMLHEAHQKLLSSLAGFIGDGSYGDKFRDQVDGTVGIEEGEPHCVFASGMK